MNEFYSFRAEVGDDPASAELLIFDAIGSWEDMGEISAKGFARDLDKLPKSVRRLDIHINSPGGSVYDAQGIYSRLADHRAEKIVYIDGLAASAASIVAMVGHKIYIRANANIMIHLPSAITLGTEDDHEKTIRALRSITSAMLNTYTKKTGLDKGNIREMLAAETWFTAEEAVEHGFADEVRGVVKAAATAGSKRVIFNGVEFDLSRFNNVPAFAATTTKEKVTMATKKETAAEDKPPKAEETTRQETHKETHKEEAPVKEETQTEELTTEERTIPKKPAKDFDKVANTAVAAERARVTALQKMDRPATHDIVAKAITEGTQPADIFEACFDAMDKASKQQSRRIDAKAVDGIPPSDGSDDSEEDFGELLTRKVSGALKARGFSVSQGRN